MQNLKVNRVEKFWAQFFSIHFRVVHKIWRNFCEKSFLISLKTTMQLTSKELKKYHNQPDPTLQGRDIKKLFLQKFLQILSSYRKWIEKYFAQNFLARIAPKFGIEQQKNILRRKYKVKNFEFITEKTEKNYFESLKMPQKSCLATKVIFSQIYLIVHQISHNFY